MSKDYIGKNKKSGGILGLVIFCIMAFAVTFVISYAVNSNVKDNKKTTAQRQEEDMRLSKELDRLFSEKDESAPDNTAAVQQKPEEESKPAQPQTAETVVRESEPEPEPIEEVEVSAHPEKAVVPIENGSIAKKFGGKPEYSQIYEDWRTHTGVDIAGKEGDNVRVIADGIVVESYIDPAAGGTLVVDHGAFYSVYKGLSEETMEMNGTALKKGDSVGTLEGKILGESAEPHLHFEIIENDIYTDPMKYLG